MGEVSALKRGRPESPRMIGRRQVTAALAIFYLGWSFGIVAGRGQQQHQSESTLLAASLQFDASSLANERAQQTIPHQPQQDSKNKNSLFRPNELKLPTPILVLGMMKAGTTSIYSYFKCGLDPDHSKLSHYDCNPPGNKRLSQQGMIGMSCGKRMRRNLTKNKKPAFFSMDDFDVYAELDAQELNGGMTLPQWEYLQAMHDQFPNATWIMNLRDPFRWLESVNRWKDLRQRFIDLSYEPEFPKGKGTTDQEMVDFYWQQAQKVRDFVSAHLSHTLIEVVIDAPEAGSIMEAAFGIPQVCWGNRNANNNNGTAIWAED